MEPLIVLSSSVSETDSKKCVLYQTTDTRKDCPEQTQHDRDFEISLNLFFTQYVWYNTSQQLRHENMQFGVLQDYERLHFYEFYQNKMVIHLSGYGKDSCSV